MDHLPVMQDPAFLWLRAPYYEGQLQEYATPALSHGDQFKNWATEQVKYSVPAHFGYLGKHVQDKAAEQAKRLVQESRPLQWYREQFMEQALDHSMQQDYSAFVQEWLFFGLLTEFFAACELPFHREDFVQMQDETPSITTAALNDYLLALVVQEDLRQQRGSFSKTSLDLKDNDGMNRYGTKTRTALPDRRSRWRLIACHEIIKEVRDALKIYVTPNIGLLQASVWDTVVILAASLSRAVDSVYRPLAYNYEEYYYPIEFHQFHFRGVPDMRRNENWCPHERKLLESLVEGRLQEIAFFSLLKRRHAIEFHSKCSDQLCSAHQVTGQYHTQHVDPDCRCESLGVDKEDRGEATSNEETPLQLRMRTMAFSKYGKLVGADTQYDNFHKRITAVVYSNDRVLPVNVAIGAPPEVAKLDPSIARPKLVAISHVWSDGLGNKDENTLPICQLARLRRLANKLCDDNEDPVPFWIDTLMIPVIPEDADKETRELKRHALRDMEWVYKEAPKVLILDKDLLALDATGLQSEELGASVMSSTWSRLLWTLQEGCVAENTYLQLRDRAVLRTKLHQDVLRVSGVSAKRRRNSVLPESHPIRKLQELPWMNVHWKGFPIGPLPTS